jgi:putative tryptophan/tyrosine transport system substrate-binding protein
LRLIADLALKFRPASTGGSVECPQAGGRLSFGPDFPDNFRRSATCVGMIVKASKPADLPGEQPTR